MADKASLELTEKGALVESLWHAVDEASGNLQAVPGLIRRVLETGAWKERAQRGKVYRHNQFIDFITAKPLEGCGWPIDKVEVLIKDDPESLLLWRQAITPPKHVHHDGDNVTINSDGRGNSRSYTLDRLSRERPDLFEQVKAGELTANAAAIKAGFRKKPTPFQQIKKLLLRLTDTERAQLRELLDAAEQCQ